MEACGKGLAEQRLNIAHLQPRQPIAKSPDLMTDQSAGCDLGKTLEVAIHIESQPMLRNPTAAAHTNRRHLAPLHPHTVSYTHLTLPTILRV